METKKKSKAPIIIIILILLVAAGFGYYKFVYQPQQMAKYELTESEVVETELVAGTDWHDNEMDEYKEIFEAMAENDASYFIVESMTERSDDYYSPRFKIYQTNKDEFSELSVKVPEEVVIGMTKGMLRFLNYSYNSLPPALYENLNGNYMFGKIGVSSMAEETIEPQFDGSVAAYFKKHKLKLKCDDCKVEQIGIEVDQNNHLRYYFNFTANVLTESCTGDMSDLGFFANEGETKEMNISVLCSGYEDSDTIGDLHVDTMIIN